MAFKYSSDLHFNLPRIIGQCGRPFASLADMRDKLISNFREELCDDDDLIIVGDFAHKNSDPDLATIFAQIPGRKHLVIGNHDMQSVLDLPWTSKSEMLEMEDGDHRLCIFHYPMATWKQAREGVIHLFGHVHNNYAGKENAINVGVDLWEYRPVTLDQILDRAMSLERNVFQQTLDGIEKKGAL